MKCILKDCEDIMKFIVFIFVTELIVSEIDDEEYGFYKYIDD